MHDAILKIRRATSEDAAALAEFGARTFYETFAADNTPEDMARHLASAWSPDLQRAEIADPLLDTLLAVDANGNYGGFAQLQAECAPAEVPTTASTVMSATKRAKAVPASLPGPVPDALLMAIGARTRPMAATMAPVTTGGISFSTQRWPATWTTRPISV